MLKSYFRIAYRHMVRNKIFSLINVSGLAVGIASAFLILQYLSFEMGYDQFHENKDEIFRVTYQQRENGELKHSSAGTFYGVGAFMKENFPEVEHVTRFYKWPASTGVLLMFDNKIFNERNYFFADPEFFKVFPTLLVRGDPSSCLINPNSVIISKRLAMKIFGATDVLGKVMSDADYKHGGEMQVTGVMNDIPENSHFDLDVVRPFETDWIPPVQARWRYIGWHTYATIRKGTSIRGFENKLNAALQKDQRDNPFYNDVFTSLQPITDIHLHSHLDNDELKANGNISVIYGISGAFVIILMIAWINYVNLETARFITRVKEVGVRRIVGSSKSELVSQFFIQYLFVNALALILAGIIVYISLPYYHFITGASIDEILLFTSWLLEMFVAIFVIGTLIAGIYPALLLTKFNLVASLKGKMGGSTQGSLLRKSLLVFQFASSFVLIAFLIIIFQQLDFMRKINGNINLDRILTVYNPTNYSAYEDSSRMEKNAVFRTRLLQNPSIINLTTSSAIPGEPVGFTYVDLAKRTLNDPDKQVPYKVIYIDYDFIPVFGLKLKAGRNYSEDTGDHNCLIVTESAIRNLGFSSIEEALDKEIYFMEDDWDKWKIIGIIEDYRHESVKDPIYPTIFRLHRNRGQMVYYSTLLNSDSDYKAALSAVQKAWQETWPEKPFEYLFLDNYYDQQYKSEIHFSRIFSLFACVAVFIACLGILGMTLFEVGARLKEMSIRKVLGASAVSLVVRLSRNHIRAVLLSIIIAVPLIYFIAQEWLSTYPIRIAISPILFLVPLCVILVLVIITSCFQTIKAANANPVEHLKSE